MSCEILYTSAPAGLKPGSSGYCTVKSSLGIPAPTLEQLESLSGYRHVFPAGGPDAVKNPVNWGHYVLRVSGRMEHILSRVSDCDLDYTGRSNKLAHHMVVDTLVEAGPAWLLGRQGWMTDRWDGKVEQISRNRTPPDAPRPLQQCRAWKEVTGDAGWAGVLAESFLADRQAFVIFPPETNVLALFEEAIALLPENRRWDVTFATYGASLPKTVECVWMGIVAGSPEVQQSRRFANALRIDLTRREPVPPGGALVETARTGVVRKNESPQASTSSIPTRLTSPGERGTLKPPARERIAPVPLQSSDDLEPPSIPLPMLRSDRRQWPILLIAVIATILFALITTVGLLAWKKTQPADTIAATTPGVPPTDSSSTGSRSAPPHNSAPDLTQPSQRGSAPTPSQPPPAPPIIQPSPEPEKQPAPSVPEVGATKDPASDSSSDTSMPTESSKKEVASTAPQEDKPSTSGTAHPPQGADEPQRVFLKQHQEIQKNPQQLRFSGEGQILLPNYSKVSLLIPREREGVSENLFRNIYAQKYSSNSLEVMPQKGLALSAPHFVIRFNRPSDGPQNVEWQLKVGNFADHYKVALSHSVLQLQDDDERNLFLVLSPQPRKEKTSFPVKKETTDIVLSDEKQGLASLIRPDDLVIENLTLKLGGQPVPLVPEASNAWDISMATHSHFSQIELLPSLKLGADERIRLEWKVNELKVKQDENKKLLEALGNEYSTKWAPQEKGVQGINALRPKAKDGNPEQTIKEMTNKFSDNLSKKEKPKDKKEDEFKKENQQELEKFKADADSYLQRLFKFRECEEAIRLVNEELIVASGRIRYKVFPLGLHNSSEPTLKLPNGKDHLLVDLWEFDDMSTKK